MGTKFDKPFHSSLLNLIDEEGDKYQNSQPRSLGVLTSYADHEAEGTPWYTSIKFAQKFRQIWKPLWISPLARQRKATENGCCCSANFAEDGWRNRKQTRRELHLNLFAGI